MGYAYYDTPRGPAGYDVPDVCHEPGCDEEINRGLAFACGDMPGHETDEGCGWWFCYEHLVVIEHGNRCIPCDDRLTKEG